MPHIRLSGVLGEIGSTPLMKDRALFHRKIPTCIFQGVGIEIIGSVYWFDFHPVTDTEDLFSIIVCVCDARMTVPLSLYQKEGEGPYFLKDDGFCDSAFG